eukprot:GHVS01041403.1.p1 GENE.GHVS01041403.1~~GHVS01041403.1.p1  ORF type:complete len:281 (+),score=23.52 GHVS01041403.1:187-1029(+)
MVSSFASARRRRLFVLLVCPSILTLLPVRAKDVNIIPYKDRPEKYISVTLSGTLNVLSHPLFCTVPGKDSVVKEEKSSTPCSWSSGIRGIEKCSENENGVAVEIKENGALLVLVDGIYDLEATKEEDKAHFEALKALPYRMDDLFTEGDMYVMVQNVVKFCKVQLVTFIDRMDNMIGKVMDPSSYYRIHANRKKLDALAQKPDRYVVVGRGADRLLPVAQFPETIIFLFDVDMLNAIKAEETGWSVRAVVVVHALVPKTLEGTSILDTKGHSKLLTKGHY